jgi:uncharacterized membrane protein
MESKAKLLGHPIHQMLIVFPLGLLSTAVIFDIITMLTNDTKWSGIAFYLIAAGVIGGLAAAIFGFVDWLAIPGGTRAKSVGMLHGVGNIVVTVLFAISWIIRAGAADPAAPDSMAYFLSFAAFILTAFTAWLGGELVDRLGVGVDEGAHLNAPNSLSGRPASEQSSDVQPTSLGR